MSYGELQPLRPYGVPAPVGTLDRAEASAEVERAAEALAHELAERLGWKVKVEVTARLGGQMACAAARATPPDGV